MRRAGWPAITAAWTIAALMAGCATSVSSPVTGAPNSSTITGNDVSPGPFAPYGSTTIAAPSPESILPGAQLRVQLEGTSGCDPGFICSARLGVLPAGTTVDPGATLEPSASDAVWQSDYGPGMSLIPPPDGDLPMLAQGAYVIVWSVTAQQIVTDPPVAPAELASRCSTPVVVSAGQRTATVRIRFAGGSTLAPGSARCTMHPLVEADATPVPTPGAISGVALTPTATLPTAWRRVATANLAALGDPGFRVALGVAPDGAFIAIPNGGERRSLPVLRSVDGEAWTKVGVLPASKDGWIHAVASNSDVIVVTGGSSDASRPVMWVSADGTNWTAITAAHTSGLDIVDALAANSAGFVATQNGATGVAPWIGSAKGGEWDRVGSLTATLDAAMVDVTASGSGFVGVGRVGGVDGTAAAWLSSDGRTWTPATVADGMGVTLLSVAASGHRLIAFGQGASYRDDPVLFVSEDDGRSWTQIVGGARPQTSWPPVQAVADGFIATDYGVWTSHDGVTWDDTAWTRAAGDAPAGRVPSVAANGTRVVAAAMPNGGGSPIFWIGESSRP